MKLPKAIFYNDKIYTDIDIKKPKGIVISDVQEIASNGDIYTAMYLFVHGCTESIYNSEESIDDRNKLKELCKAMPYRSVEYVAIQIVLLHDPSDYIEGVYQCPRCPNKIIAELKDNIDTRDRIADLELIIDTDNCNYIDYQLPEPLIVKSIKGDIVVEVDSIRIDTPTISQCALSTKQTGLIGGGRFQANLYKNCISKVNGEAVTPKYRAEWALYLFEQMYGSDLKEIYALVTKYGWKQSVKKICPSCGKVWEAPVNTTNFFVSGLQSN